MNQLLEAYSGDRAVGYDARRETSTRWRSEIAAMEKLLDTVSAISVLDCPFGTGRWLPQYATREMRTIGIDISADMLSKAQEKINKFPSDVHEKCTLRQGSIFDLHPSQYVDKPDLIVCVRFLNWINFDDVEKVVNLLTECNSDDMIVGASVVPKEAGKIRKRCAVVFVITKLPSARSELQMTRTLPLVHIIYCFAEEMSRLS